MAGHGPVEYETASGNDYAEHEATYNRFVQIVKWTTGGTVIALILLAYFLI